MPVATKIQPAPTASAILPLVLVFLCGVTVGALVMNVGLHNYLHRVVSPAETGKTLTLDRWKRELNLTPAQTQQLESLLDDFSKYYDNVLADGNTRVMQLLDEKQKQKFRQIIRERQH